LTNEINQGYSL